MGRRDRWGPLAAGLVAALLFGALAAAQPAPGAAGQPDRTGDHTVLTPEGLVNLDFQDVELAVVIDTIAKLTGKNFLYDDRVRGRVTIVSPTPIPVDQAYTVFESMLQVKGFTTVEAPGGVIKVIPIRDAKETSVDTRSSATGRTPDTDQFVTRLIPLSYIDAEAISNTLKPLVSKDAALVAYAPTNTVILTDSASNIRRILSILQAIDVETYKEELAVLRVEYADAAALAQQLSEVFGGEVVASTAAGGQPGVSPRLRRQQGVVTPQVTPGVPGGGGGSRGQVRIITDDRTNALIILASRSTLEEMRALIRKLDVPVEGGGRIQVYYLKYADAEELAETLNSLLGGSSTGGTVGGVGQQPGIGQQAIRAAVTELAGAVTSVTADVGTNALVIQASPEGFEALVRVIEKLDIERPQVLVEALIMEVLVFDGQDLGFNGLYRLVTSSFDVTVETATDAVAGGLLGGPGGAAVPFLTNFLRQTVEFDSDGNPIGTGSIIQGILRASARDNSTNILSAPHVLTSDNEEAEILVGDNIPIITNRVQSAGGVTTTDPDSTLATSVNVERQDIGVTLRVTPQITEGASMRLEIFQEITAINRALQSGVGNVDQVGPALSNRRVENTVVVADGETVVIGGLVSDNYDATETKVPWLGDIPVLGWAFKTRNKELTKRNLLVFLTPHIVRSPDDLEAASIAKREEFRRRSEEALGEKDGPQPPPLPTGSNIGFLGEASDEGGKNPTATAISTLDQRYPLERMREIERAEAQQKESARAAAAGAGPAARFMVLGGTYTDSQQARGQLTELVDAGYEGTLLSTGERGRLALELRLGPYRSLEDAERAAETLRRAYGMTPRVLIEREERQ